MSRMLRKGIFPKSQLQFSHLPNLKFQKSKISLMTEQTYNSDERDIIFVWKHKTVSHLNMYALQVHNTNQILDCSV